MKFNVHFFIMLILSCIVALSDILIYSFGLNYIVTIVIGLILACILLFTFRKKITVKSDFEVLDIVCFIIVSIKFIIMIMKVDNAWDTRNYHIYLQENPFIDKIHFDFFARKDYKYFSISFGR